VSARRWGEASPGEANVAEKFPPGPHRLPRAIVRAHQRQRILLAALDVFATRGFAATTVKDLIGAAHVSRATFYEAFADKEACFVALHDELLTWLTEQVAPAVSSASDWPAQVRTAVARTVELLSVDPRIAKLCALEALVCVPAARDRHDQVVEELSRSLRLGRAGAPEGRELPEILEPALICGTIYTVGRVIADGREPDAGTLAAELAELLLIPYRP
jgi:AcrR family transcriptional regulator